MDNTTETAVAQDSKAILQWVYDNKAIEIEDDAVNPFVGLHVSFEQNHFRWRPRPKDIARQLCYGERGWQPLQHHCSWRPQSVEEATVIGMLHKCSVLSSDLAGRSASMIEYLQACREVAGIPAHDLRAWSLEWTKKQSYSKCSEWYGVLRGAIETGLT